MKHDNIPFRLLDCLRLVMAPRSGAVAASWTAAFGVRGGDLLAGVWAVGLELGLDELRKREGEGMVMVSAMGGGHAGRNNGALPWSP
jgi:hypothetical protein